MKSYSKLTQSCSQTQQVYSSPFISKSSQSSHKVTLGQKHYFQQFSLYCFRRGKHSLSTINYKQSNVLPIVQISSLEKFFQYFLALKKPSQLLVDSKIMLFYKKCKPFWEQWLKSGCLLINFKNRQEQQNLLDIIWEYLCYALIGNNIDSDVIGVCVCKRQKMTLVQIWLKRSDRAKQIGIALDLQIRKQLPPQLGVSLNSVLKVKYKKHSDSINTNSTIKGAQNLTQVNFKKSQLNNSF